MESDLEVAGSPSIFLHKEGGSLGMRLSSVGDSDVAPVGGGER